MIFSKIFENISHSEHSRGSKHLATRVEGAPPASWAHGASPPLIPATTHSLFLPKNNQPAQARVLAHLADIFDLLAQSSIHKTALGIVLLYVTPPMVQLVFVLVLYLLQIFAA